MNKNDSERIAGLLSSLGFKSVNKPEKAGLLIINTCSVRQASEDRVFGTIRNWQKLRKKNPNLIIAVTGCMPGRDKDGKLKKKLKGVDLFFPIRELPLLTVMLDRDVACYVSTSNDYWQFIPKREENSRAFITIQTGCNNFCSYCVVPYARGREKNRSVKDILKEIRSAVKNGSKEITLLGQVVNNFRLQISDLRLLNKKNLFKQEDDFAALLWEINQIPGEFRLHWTASDPQYFNQAQIQALTLPKQVNYLHLPVQSGDNGILKKMNRKYTREYYINLVKKIRKARPGIAIGADIIIGFCGETEEQFQNTVDLYKKCDFDIAYLAMYSERSGTLAAKKFKDDVPRTEKKRRWQVLQDLMEKITYQKNQKYIGKTVSVLVDNYKNGWCSGNFSEMKLVKFSSRKNLIGKIVKVKISQAQEWILRGEVV